MGIIENKMKKLTLGALLVLTLLLLCGCAETGEKEGCGVWPECGNTKGVPKPAFDYRISQSFDNDGVTGIVFSGVTSDQADRYLGQLKAAGFTWVESSSEYDGSVSYVAQDTEGIKHLCYTYEGNEQRLSIFIDQFDS